MKIYLATWLLEVSQGKSLTKVGCKKRLMSYFHTKDKEKLFIPYIEKGK